MNAFMYEQTFGRTNMGADRQTDRQTDERTQTYALQHAILQTQKACIDEPTHVRLNIWIHEQARGQTGRHTDKTDRRTDGHAYALTHARMHTHDR